MLGSHGLMCARVCVCFCVVRSTANTSKILFVSLKMDKAKVWCWWYDLVHEFVVCSGSLLFLARLLACMLQFNHLLRYTFCWRECVIIKNEQLHAGNEVKLFFPKQQRCTSGVYIEISVHVKSVVRKSSTTNKNCVKMILSHIAGMLHQFLFCSLSNHLEGNCVPSMVVK